MFLVLISTSANLAQTLIFHDDFSTNRNHWTIGDNTNSALTIVNGKYVLENKINQFAKFPLPIENSVAIDQTKNFSIETEITYLGGDANYPFGFFWGYKDARNLYEFGVLQNGKFYYGKSANGNWMGIVDKLSPNIAIGIGKTNKLAIKKRGERVEFYINDVYADSAKFEPFSQPATLGFNLNFRQKIAVEYLKVTQDLGEDLTSPITQPSSPLATTNSVKIEYMVDYWEGQQASQGLNLKLGKSVDGKLEISELNNKETFYAVLKPNNMIEFRIGSNTTGISYIGKISPDNQTMEGTYIKSGQTDTFFPREGKFWLQKVDFLTRQPTVKLTSALAYNNAGVDEYKKMEYEKAIVLFSECLRLDPKFTSCYINRGNAFAERYSENPVEYNFEYGINDFNKAIQLEPNVARRFYDRGVLYSGKFSSFLKITDEAITAMNGAIADFNKAILIDPRYEDAYLERGYVYKTAKQNDKAIADYQKVLELNPNNQEAKKQLMVLKF